MKIHSREQLNRFWADRLGIDSSLARTPSICCTVQHLYSGVQLFANSERVVIASPPAKAELIQKAIIDLSPEEVFSVEWLQRILANDAGRIIGPAEVHYADETSFRSEQSHGGRALLATDSVAYRGLVAALDPKEVEYSGVSSEVFPALEVFP